MAFASAVCTVWLFAVHATLTAQLPNGVTINRLDVPAVVALNGQPAVVLDCDYNVTDTAGLVVKWFFNNPKNPVYQWIPPHKPQDLGVLKGKLDFDYKASDSPLQSQRALRIVSPGVNLSGNYTCVVSTFQSEDQLTKPMLVFSPGHKLDFEYVRQESEDSVHLVCSVESVYPQPIITIKRFSVSLPDQKTVVQPKDDGLLDLMVLATANNSELLSREKFSCEMRIPEANYTAKEFITYIPRPETTTTQPHTTETIASGGVNETTSASTTILPPSSALEILCLKFVVLYISAIFLPLYI